jgi:hypothetical protein
LRLEQKPSYHEEKRGRPVGLLSVSVWVCRYGQELWFLDLKSLFILQKVFTQQTMAFDDSYNDTVAVEEPVNLDIEVTESGQTGSRFAGAGDKAKDVAKKLGLGLLSSINPFATILGYVVIVKVVADEIKWHRNVSYSTSELQVCSRMRSFVQYHPICKSAYSRTNFGCISSLA